MSGPILAGAALFALAGLPGLRAQTSEFITGAGTEWNNASSWSNGIPTSGTGVLLDTGSPGGANTLDTNFGVADITYSTVTATTLNNAAGDTVTLTLNGSGSAPVIELNSTGNLTVANGATGTLGLVLAGNNNTIDSKNSGGLIVTTGISGTGGLALTNTNNVSTPGTITFSGTNSFTGGLAITGHGVVLDVNSDATLGAAGGSVTINGGRLEISASTTINSARTLYLGSNPGGVSTNGTLSTKGGGTTVTYDGIIQDVAGSVGDLVKQGSGTLDLGGANAYSGGTYLNNGTTKLLAANALPTTTSVSIGQTASSNTGALNLNGNSVQVAGLDSVTGTGVTTTNTVTSSTATLTLNEAGGQSFTYGSSSANNSGIIGGAISLVKTGAGTQVLGGVNTYTGTTAINGGVLAVNGSTAVGSAVSVNSTGTLAGTGTVKGGLTLNSGGMISPGTAVSGGVLTLGGNVTLNAGGTLNFQLSTAAQGELVLSGTGITLTGPASGTVAVNLVDVDQSETLGSTLTLVGIQNAPGSSSNWSASDFTLDAPSEWGGSVLELGTNGSLEVTLEASAVPEPSTYAGIVGALALAGAAALRRRRNGVAQ
jgi:autotransporter-associated beta strand protein